MRLTIRTVSGRELEPYIDAIARLRIEVFREFPYLYDGDEEYERKYMRVYSESEGSVCVLALAESDVVGASTGLPLVDADEEFRAPFRQSPAWREEDVFYFGESILREAFRGRGVGHRFFDEREAHAARLGYPIATFSAVDRPADHPLRPAGYRSLERFWTGRGYRRRPELVAKFAWKDIGEEDETYKPMTFWARRLNAADPKS